MQKLRTIPLSKPFFSKGSRAKILAGIEHILESGCLINGEFGEKFEQGHRNLTGAQEAVALNSCSTALQICLQHIDVSGYEVLVPSGSFVADINVVLQAGGIPVLVDMNPETLSFDLNDLKRKLTVKTKAMIWVHLTGLISGEYKEIISFARNHDLFLIEDCAHAHGAEINGQKAGSLGDAGCFSYYPTKIITSGAGGMLTTNKRALADYARTVRYHGRNSDAGEVTEFGNNWYLDEIRACIGFYQLEELAQNLERRRQIASRYNQNLAHQQDLELILIPEGSKPSYYQYVVILNSRINFPSLRKVLMEKHGISIKNIYRPTHEEPIFRNLDNGSLKVTEKTLHQSLCLPMFFELTDNQVDKISSAVIQELRNFK
ncbi:MAG: perosamine synthetase [Nitrospinales bacterium]|jgi:perosamine synthetase